jgi:hypothetical protein
MPVSKTKRSIRVVFVMVSAMSLLVVLALAALWLRSYWLEEKIEWTTKSTSYYIHSASGLVLFLYVTPSDAEPGILRYQSWTNQGQAWQPFTFLSINRLGFTVFKSATGRTRACVMPFWFLVCVTATASVPSVNCCRRYLRKRRCVKQGLCVKCGYNLTGNVSGVCPECGEKV